MYTTITPLIVSLMMCLLTFSNAGQNPPEPLTVIVSAADTQAVKSGIRLAVEITNNTDRDFELTIRENKPPFFLRVVNDKGWDLNRNETKGLSKDRHQKNISLVFKPHEKKTYQVTFLEFVDDDDKKKPVPVGVYKISAHVPIISYVQGSLKIKQVDSNLMEVTLK